MSESDKRGIITAQARRVGHALQWAREWGRLQMDALRLRLQTKTPHEALVEMTNRCNLNCPFCMVGRQNDLTATHGNAAHSLMKRRMGVMSPETFERVRAELKRFGIRNAYLYFQGEPFLNVNTIPFAAQLKKDGLFVAIYTNGQAFSGNMIQELAEAEIDLIRFSVDGASEETYQKNRVGGKFAAVYENMRLVVEAHRGKRTRIEWQFIAMQNNEHEVEAARLLAGKIGILFFVKGFRESVPALAPTKAEYAPNFIPKPCTDIYRHLGIYWNGDVVPCCYDNDAVEVMGNVMENSLKKIWRSARYRQFRTAVKNVRVDPGHEPELCRTCLRWR